jgi:O-antigen/teichoic acid export membrane protein
VTEDGTTGATAGDAGWTGSGRHPLRRLLAALPPGMLAVGAGLVILGGASYVHLAVASRALSRPDYSAMSVVWAIVFSIGLGLFMPIEQEITRLVAARRAAGGPAGGAGGPVLRRGAVLAAAVLALLLLAVVAAARPIADRLFAGDVGLVWALGAALAGLAVAHTTRGLLAGAGAFGWYGAQLGVDGGLRMALAAGLAVAGVRSPVAYALILAAGPLGGVLATLPAVLREARPGAAVAWADLVRGLLLLTASSLLAQLVVNIGVVNVRILEPAEELLAGALLSAIVLARIPLFVFASLQAALLPGLSHAVAAGDRAGYRSLLVRALGLVALLGLGGGVPAVLLGPWAVRVLFNQPGELGAADFAWLAAGTLAYMAALVLGQAAQAMGRHRDQTLAWLAGTAVLLAVTLLPGDIKLRVELAYAAGSLVTALGLALVATRSAPRRDDSVPVSQPATAVAATTME